MSKLTEIYGSNVFNDYVMKARLPKIIYKSLKSTIEEGKLLQLDIAEVVASAMKTWAVEKGATHFTHWFQPMTGITAEKHDSFISPTPDGKVILEFSGKELIKGEPDASSFPSGGLRSTFKARGYTAWDCTSPAFVKDNTLYIPTAFCSYNGESLDNKTPLLRSIEALSKQAIRVLRVLGNKTSKTVISTVGPEQEYFIIDKELYDKRNDLILTGRTLFGAKPPKGQQLEDHYFGSIKERISNFMRELDEELWKLGIAAKTEHNEVAPAQHELAPIFNTTNIATDHNQLTMEMMKKVALRHGLVCLLHEKPFAGINGSGKHNNWSIATDDGMNLLEPGSSPHNNQQFLLFLCAVIEAVDEYADLLRVSAANPGNDHRLGANEAPPAIISIFLGDQLTDILEQIEQGCVTHSKSSEELKIGVSTLPPLPRDTTDRNRTSPFAFTGNKFEFRMVPSSTSISEPNYTLNTIVAEVLSKIADRIENSNDKNKEIQDVITEIVKNHKKIIFNGNGYSKEWIEEAKNRGLSNISSTVEAIKALKKEKNLEVMEKHKVLSRAEMESRYEVLLENYSKIIDIEALTMVEIAKRQIIPSVIEFTTNLSQSIISIKGTGLVLDISAQSELLTKVSHKITSLDKNITKLEKSIEEAQSFNGSSYDQAILYKTDVFKKMDILRADADELETMVDAKYWPLPTYTEMLFNI